MQKKINYVGIFAFILLIIAYAYTTWMCGGHWIDSDSTSELMLGKLLAETDKLVTSDWYYSTSIRVFNINIIYFLCWKIFQSWKAVRCVSQVLGLTLLYLSQCFFTIRRKANIICCGLIFYYYRFH